MSSLFGGGGPEGPSSYDLTQDDIDVAQSIAIQAVQDSIATSQNIAPLVARLDQIDIDQLTQDNNISQNSIDILQNTNDIASLQTSVSNKLNTSTFNSFIISNDVVNLVQDTAILDLQTSLANKLDTSVHNSYVTSQNTLNNTQDTNIANNTSSISSLSLNKADKSALDAFIASQSLKDAQQDLLISTLNGTVGSDPDKLDVTVYNTFVSSQSGRDSDQDTAINSKVNLTTYNSEQATQNTNISNLQTQKLDISTYNTDKALQLTKDNTQDSRLTALESGGGYVTTSTYNTFVSNQNAIDSLQDAQLVLLEASVANKLDTATYNADKALTDSTISFLNSSLNANDVLTDAIDARVDVLEARTYPQTALQTPYTAIANITGALNVQTALASLQTNINNIVVSGTGLDPYIVTQLNTMLTAYLTNPRFTGSAIKWHFLNRIDQDLNSNTTGNPNWPRLAIISGNGSTSNLDTTRCFSVFGNSTGNNDSYLLSLFKDGRLLSTDKLFVGGSVIDLYELSRNGLRLRTTATLGSCDGGASINYNEAIIRLNTITQTRAEQLRDLRFPTMILNIPTQAVATPVFTIYSSESDFYPVQITNQGRFSLHHTDNNRVVDMNPNEGIRIKGYGAGGVPDSAVFQINAPADAEARCQMFNNGRLRLWGSTRPNAPAPSFDVLTNGDAILQGILSSNQVFTDYVNSNTLLCNSGTITNFTAVSMTLNGSPLEQWKIGNGIILHNTVQFTPSIDKDISICTLSRNDLNGFVGSLPTVVIGANLDVRVMSQSVVLGNSNAVMSASSSQIDAAAICIGSGNSCTNVASGTQLINIGFGNDTNCVSPQDNSWRISLGSGNVVRGSSSVVVGTFNNVNSSNVNGAINSHYVLGNNWSGSACIGLNGEVRESTVFLGNALAPNDAYVVLGGGGLPPANFDQLASCQSVSIQWQQGLTNPKGSLVRVPSARKYKKDIKNYDYDISDFMKLRTIEHNGHCRGLIADDVDEITTFKYLVQKLNGEVEGLHYEGFVVPLINVVQQQQQKINELETKLNLILSKLNI